MSLVSSIDKIQTPPIITFQANDVFPLCQHMISEVSKTQDSFKLHDGSIWEVDEEDQIHLSTLKSGDSIAIVLSDDLNKYEIIKMDEAHKIVTAVKASLYTTPFPSAYYEDMYAKGTPASRSAFEIIELNESVIAINYLDPVINFPQPIKFKVSAESQNEMKRWQATDVIILGLQSRPDAQGYQPNQVMLINCTLSSHINVVAL